ncbi:hypothetical protein FDECE_1488 [Fusarium decemcellulare]|nr:hypothetical protein FDECE_1488 [Fusarium decemcellulare]
MYLNSKYAAANFPILLLFDCLFFPSCPRFFILSSLPSPSNSSSQPALALISIATKSPSPTTITLVCHSLRIFKPLIKMSFVKLAVIAALLTASQAQRFPNEDLILADCGIGDNPDHPKWSTSRQMNWYKDIKWPDAAYKYPDAPDLAVEIPYKGGKYPWIPEGATGRMPNGVVWTAYIEDSTPDGFKAGSAVTTKEGGQMLNCWAYRGRPVSAALNKTANPDAVCWTAFVCNRDDQAPPRPEDMGSHTSSLTTSSAPPATTFVSTPPPTPIPSPTGGEPAPTQDPNAGKLFVDAAVSPRFLNWPNTWQAFIDKFSWDRESGRCTAEPIKGDGYTINVECAGIQIDSDSHLTLLMIKALRDLGLNSTLFNQNPTIPQNKSNSTTEHWVVMPEAFNLQAVDLEHQKIIGYLGYNTTYDNFQTGPCSACDTSRFDKQFFDPILDAMKGTYPLYNRYNVEAQCSPWMACK